MRLIRLLLIILVTIGLAFTGYHFCGLWGAIGGAVLAIAITAGRR